MRTTALVITGGGSVRAPMPPGLDGALVIAADGGVAEAIRLGLDVDILVGDLDSASHDDIALVEAAGAEIERHPIDKDATDLELAMARAVREGVTRIVVLGGDGGRLDHLLGNAMVLASPRWAGLQVEAILGAATITVIRGERVIEGEPGDTLSLFAVGGTARGITTEGLRWALHDADLAAGTSLGISNAFREHRAVVRVHEGVVLAVAPGEGG
ncbi:MAG: thiamine diphosphokinase [Actinomycetota bacterium]